jgi:hypothetical protein
MKSSEYMDEGIWDTIKSKVAGAIPGTPTNIAKTAQRQAAYYDKISNDRAFKSWQQHFSNVSRINPSIDASGVQAELVKWIDDRLKDKPGTSLPTPTYITGKSDFKNIYKYIGDRLAEYFSKPSPAGTPTPSTEPADTAVKGLAVVSNDPIIFNYQNSFYYLNDAGQWVVSKSPSRPGTVLPSIWQQFFSKQHDIVLGVKESKTVNRLIIVEGGNVFKNADGSAGTQRINQVDVEPTIAWLERITGLSLVPYMLGSTGKNITSGDLDIAVDPMDKQQLVTKLEQWSKINNVNPKKFIKKSGISVHFKTPILGNSDRGYVQTDFMFGNVDWLKFSMQGGEPGSKFKGLHRAILLSSIAKVYGLKWSPTQGLVSRNTNAVISQDPDQIAVYLLGSDATAKDLTSVESVLRKIKQQPNFQELIAQAKETLAAENLHLI